MPYITQKQLQTLKEVVRVATMKTASFGDNTDDIRKTTKLWRDTWIIAPLQRVIKELEDKE